MKFDDLDKAMRVYETSCDRCVIPGMYIVTRIDGRSFTRLTKETCRFEAPFDVKMRDLMAETVRHLMNCGFTVIYGYTESDEISLLHSINETAFSRKHRKFNSILAGEASAIFTHLLGKPAAFDCRVCELPSRSAVTDYFRWRMEDAHRNALNAHCYWKLRFDGKSQGEATAMLSGMGLAGKNELLFSYGTNFNDLPLWQKRGIGFYYKMVEKEGVDPRNNAKVAVMRRGLATEYELPMNDAYAALLNGIMDADEKRNS